MLCHSSVNSTCLRLKFEVNGADDDAAMPRKLPVQADEVSSIDGQDGPIFGCSEFQDFRVGYGLFSLSRLLNGENIVA